MESITAILTDTGESITATLQSADKEHTCFCNRDFTVDELKYIIQQLRIRIDNPYETIAFRDDEVDEKGGAKNPVWIVRNENNLIIKNDKNEELRLLKAGKEYYEVKLITTSEGYVKETIDNKKLYVLKKGQRVEKKKDLIKGFDKLFGNNNIENLSNINFEIFTENINKYFNDYKINTCARKIHFLAQSYVETKGFRVSYEENISKDYKGRGFLHLTFIYNYFNYFNSMYNYIEGGRDDFNTSQINKLIKNGKIKENDIKENAKKVSTDIKHALNSALWYWNKQKIYNHANSVEIKNIEMVSKLINNPSAENTESINNFEERKKYTNLLKNIMNYNGCKNNK